MTTDPLSLWATEEARKIVPQFWPGCDPECRGRCTECPVDSLRSIIATALTSAILKGQEERWRHDFPPMLQTDLRRLRAQALAAHVLHTLEDYIPHDQKRWAYDDLCKSFDAAGVEVVSDADRATAGLEPRNELGWTARELAALEKKRFELMTAPFSAILPTPPRTEGK